MTQAPMTASTPEFDAPSAARIYDCLLGGFHNFETDRVVVAKLQAYYPDISLIAQAHRAFLRRAVNFMLDQGIDQYLDVGSGLPTAGNVHQLVAAANAMASVVYVDKDPVAVAHAQALLRTDPFVAAIKGDLEDPEAILHDKDLRALLAFDRPLGLTLVAVLHYLLDDGEAERAVKALRDALAPGSYMAIVHVASETVNADHTNRRAMFGPVGSQQPRSQEQIRSLFEGFELLPPGVVYTPRWRPEGPDDLFLDEPERVFTWAAIGRKAA